MKKTPARTYNPLPTTPTLLQKITLTGGAIIVLGLTALLIVLGIIVATIGAITYIFNNPTQAIFTLLALPLWLAFIITSGWGAYRWWKTHHVFSYDFGKYYMAGEYLDTTPEENTHPPHQYRGGKKEEISSSQPHQQ